MTVAGEVSIADFGGIPDTQGVDNAPAIQAAIASFPHTWDFNGTSMAGVVRIPPGKWWCASPIVIDRQITIRGYGSPGGNAGGLSILPFANGFDAITFKSSQSATAYQDSSGATIENVEIVGPGNGASGRGVVVNSRSNLKDLLVHWFGPAGVAIVADTASSGTNANGFRLQNVRSISNVGDGFYVQGGDANAGEIDHCDAGSNGARGFNDLSFLGNWYAGCQAAANGQEAYRTTNPNACHVFAGCYVEQDQAVSINYPSLVVGGNLAEKMATGTGGTAQWIGGGGLSPFAMKSQDGSSKIEVGSANAAAVLLALRDMTEAAGAWPFRLNHVSGGFSWDWAATRHSLFRFFNSMAMRANGYGRDVYAIPQFNNVGGIGFDRGITLGSNQRYLGYVATAPVSSAGYILGDILFNEAPVPGGFAGWVMTVAGWKQWGAITP